MKSSGTTTLTAPATALQLNGPTSFSAAALAEKANSNARKVSFAPGSAGVETIFIENASSATQPEAGKQDEHDKLLQVHVECGSFNIDYELCRMKRKFDREESELVLQLEKLYAEHRMIFKDPDPPEEKEPSIQLTNHHRRPDGSLLSKPALALKDVGPASSCTVVIQQKEKQPAGVASSSQDGKIDAAGKQQHVDSPKTPRPMKILKYTKSLLIVPKPRKAKQSRYDEAAIIERNLLKSIKEIREKRVILKQNMDEISIKEMPAFTNNPKELCLSDILTTPFQYRHPIRFSRELLPLSKPCLNCGSHVHEAKDCLYTQQKHEKQMPYWRAFKINRVLDKATPCFDEDVICNHDAHFDIVQSCSLIPNVNTKFNQRPRLYDHLRIPDDFWQEWEPFFPEGVIYREFDRRALADFDEEAEEDQKEAGKQQKRKEQQGDDAAGEEDDGEDPSSKENKSPTEDHESDKESSGAVAVVAARSSERADGQTGSDAEKSEQAASSSGGDEDSSSDGESTSSLAPSSDSPTSVAARRKSAAAIKKRKQTRKNANGNKGKKEVQHENRKKGLEEVGARSLLVDENSDITITRPGGDVASLGLVAGEQDSSVEMKSELDTTTGERQDSVASHENDKDREEDGAGASHLLKQFDALEEEKRALLQSRKNRINMMLRTRAKEVNKALLLVDDMDREAGMPLDKILARQGAAAAAAAAAKGGADAGNKAGASTTPGGAVGGGGGATAATVAKIAGNKKKNGADEEEKDKEDSSKSREAAAASAEAAADKNAPPGGAGAIVDPAGGGTHKKKTDAAVPATTGAAGGENHPNGEEAGANNKPAARTSTGLNQLDKMITEYTSKFKMSQPHRTALSKLALSFFTEERLKELASVVEADVEKRLGKGLVVDMKRTEGGSREDHQTLEESLKKQVIVWEKQLTGSVQDARVVEYQRQMARLELLLKKKLKTLLVSATEGEQWDDHDGDATCARLSSSTGDEDDDGNNINNSSTKSFDYHKEVDRVEQADIAEFIGKFLSENSDNFSAFGSKHNNTQSGTPATQHKHNRGPSAHPLLEPSMKTPLQVFQEMCGAGMENKSAHDGDPKVVHLTPSCSETCASHSLLDVFLGRPLDPACTSLSSPSSQDEQQENLHRARLGKIVEKLNLDDFAAQLVLDVKRQGSDSILLSSSNTEVMEGDKRWLDDMRGQLHQKGKEHDRRHDNGKEIGKKQVQDPHQGRELEQLLQESPSTDTARPVTGASSRALHGGFDELVQSCNYDSAPGVISNNIFETPADVSRQLFTELGSDLLANDFRNSIVTSDNATAAAPCSFSSSPLFPKSNYLVDDLKALKKKRREQRKREKLEKLSRKQRRAEKRRLKKDEMKAARKRLLREKERQERLKAAERRKDKDREKQIKKKKRKEKNKSKHVVLDVGPPTTIPAALLNLGKNKPPSTNSNLLDELDAARTTAMDIFRDHDLLVLRDEEEDQENKAPTATEKTKTLQTVAGGAEGGHGATTRAGRRSPMLSSSEDDVHLDFYDSDGDPDSVLFEVPDDEPEDTEYEWVKRPETGKWIKVERNRRRSPNKEQPPCEQVQGEDGVEVQSGGGEQAAAHRLASGSSSSSAVSGRITQSPPLLEDLFSPDDGTNRAFPEDLQQDLSRRTRPPDTRARAKSVRQEEKHQHPLQNDLTEIFGGPPVAAAPDSGGRPAGKLLPEDRHFFTSSGKPAPLELQDPAKSWSTSPRTSTRDANISCIIADDLDLLFSPSPEKRKNAGRDGATSVEIIGARADADDHGTTN
ncbi:unnamed protein product [Amoebophrya sp. A120]|nr:unnamed protein product [Amoebophrya sp. A120]|eukprot:GSA120T00014274001.1